MPEISVIVPVYNVEKYLKRCVDSILGQSFTDLEIILVDDGSTDHSGVICNEYKESDSRIKVIHKKNGGLSDARNAGLDAASGKFIFFVDSDDYIADNALMILHNRAVTDGSDLVMCNVCSVCGNTKEMYYKSMPDDKKIYEGSAFFKNLIEDNNFNYVIMCNKLYSRHLFAKLRFPQGKLHEDEFMAHIIFDTSQKVSVVNKMLYFYETRNGSIMNTEFDVRRLDRAEALIERINYCIKQNYVGLTADKTVKCIMNIISEGYTKLDRKNQYNAQRLKELKNRAVYESFPYANRNSTIFLRLNMYIFRVSPVSYTLIRRVMRSIKKQINKGK